MTEAQGTSGRTTDRFVDSAGIPIAVRDYGGSGVPVLLLHGAGGNLASWDVVGPLLAESHRAVAVDLRGHGESGDGPWSWDAVVEDLEAVAAALGMERPAVVGHSLGGGLAAWWAKRHPECPAVVSIDGHRAPVGPPELFEPAAASLGPADLQSLIDQLSAQFDAQAAAMAAPLSEDQVEAILAAQRESAIEQGTDPEWWASVVRRGLVRHDDATYVRPGPETTQALRADVRTDPLPLYAELETPFLLVLATRSLPQVSADLEPLLVAFRAGLRRDLATMIEESLNAEVWEIDASHAVLFERPADVAEIIATFLGRATGQSEVSHPLT